MAARLLGPDGEPIDLSRLKEEQGGPTVTGVRQAQPEHPSWGLSPEGLSSILRDSEGTDPSRYYALLADVQEREWHYRGVLSQRRAALAQLPITVEPYSDKAVHVDQADFIRRIVEMPDFTHARFELGDALDKGMAFGNIVWDTSEKQWMPAAIKLRNPGFFRYDRADLETPRLLNEHGLEEPLAPYCWIVHRAQLNSGIPIRDGLGRAAVWAWMFKNFSIKSWQIFLDRYEMPIRTGTFPASASRAERAQLLAALRNIGRDAAAIVPEGMKIEFTKGGGGTGGGAAFKENATYFDEQLSKLVLGQTGTTDASKGGYAVGRVHEGVKDSIALYDGMTLSMTLRRDLVKPAIDLNHGPQEGYPLIKIGLGDQQNVDLLLKSIPEYVKLGLQVEQSQVYPLLGLTEPEKGRDVVLLKPPARPEPGEEPGGPSSPEEEPRADAPPRGGDGPSARRAKLSAVPAGPDARPDAIDALADELGEVDQIEELHREIEAAIDESTSLEELLARLEGMATTPAGRKLVETLGRAMFNARLAGELGAPVRDT